MSDNKKSFIVYYDNEVIVGHLPDEEAGMLFKSLFPFAKDRIKPDFKNSPALAMAFDIISMSIIRSDEKYEKKCEKNRENIKKRWNEKNTTVYDGIQSNTNYTYRDRERDRDRDKDNNNITNYQEIISMYNKTCVSFPKVSKLSDKRKKAIKARLNNYTIEDFKKLFEMAEESSFLKGQNSRNWSANFDWLICDANMAKVLDGNYVDNDRRQQSKEPVRSSSQDYYDELYSKLTPTTDGPFQ